MTGCITTKAESKLIAKQENRNDLVENLRRDFSLPIDITVIEMFNLNFLVTRKKNSVTGNRTRATWVRARYPNH